MRRFEGGEEGSGVDLGLRGARMGAERVSMSVDVDIVVAVVVYQGLNEMR